MSTTYPRPTSSPAQRPGAPLERGPSPLQSCMITTAGNGPEPSGLDSSTGICSVVPLGVVVAIERPEIAPAEPPDARDSPSASPVGTGRSTTAVRSTRGT